MIILIEKFDQLLRIYYDDGHHELIDQPLHEYAKFCKQKNQYKNPILIGNDYLYPTQNKRDKNCRWVNFKCLDNKNDYFIEILREKDILEKVVNEYISQKKKQLMKDSC